MTHKVVTTYDIVDEESAEHGDYKETGWHDEEGVLMELDEYDLDDNDDPISIVQKTVDWLIDQGAVHTSSSFFHIGIWYSTESSMDYMTGEWETLSFHPKGYTGEEEEAVFDLFEEQIRRK